MGLNVLALTHVRWETQQSRLPAFSGSCEQQKLKVAPDFHRSQCLLNYMCLPDGYFMPMLWISLIITLCFHVSYISILLIKLLSIHLWDMCPSKFQWWSLLHYLIKHTQTCTPGKGGSHFKELKYLEIAPSVKDSFSSVGLKGILPNSKIRIWWHFVSSDIWEGKQIAVFLVHKWKAKMMITIYWS